MNKQKFTNRINLPFQDMIWGLYICSVMVFLYYQRVIAIVNIPTLVHYILPLGICTAIAAIDVFFIKKLPFGVLSAILFGVFMLLSIYWFVILMETPSGSEDITEGAWVDQYWVHPIILSLYFGIAIPFLRSWILRLRAKDLRKSNNPKEIYLCIGIFAILVGLLASSTPTWPILFSFIVNLTLGGTIAVKSINRMKDANAAPNLTSSFTGSPSKGNNLMVLGNLVSTATLGWVWLAIISYNGFKFENLMPFGWGLIIYYLWKVGWSLFKFEPNLMLEGIGAMVLIVLGNLVMWWLHLNWIHLQMVLFPIWLSGIVFAVLVNQMVILLLNGEEIENKGEATKKQYNWSIVVVVLSFLVLNFMNLMYLVYRVGYYGTIDFIVFRYGIIFALISVCINGIFYFFSRRL